MSFPRHDRTGASTTAMTENRVCLRTAVIFASVALGGAGSEGRLMATARGPAPDHLEVMTFYDWNASTHGWSWGTFPPSEVS
jgi:hypothetical protein